MANRHSDNSRDKLLRHVITKEVLGRGNGASACDTLRESQVEKVDVGIGSGVGLANAGDARLEPGIKGTDVTAEQNCAGMQWYQHDSSKDSPSKLGRRLQYVTSHKIEGSPTRRPNTLLGGGFSDFESWSTTYSACHSPKGSVSGSGRLAVGGGGSFGVRSTDVTSEHSCAGMQWFQHDSSADSPDGHVRRRRFAPPLVPAESSDAARAAAAAASSPAVLRINGNFGMRSTDVTMKHNCAGLQWFQHDSSADSNEELVRRMRFAPLKETSMAAAAGAVAPASARGNTASVGPRVGPSDAMAGSITAREARLP